MTEYNFEPDYAVPTGSVLAEHCRENSISRAEFVQRSGLPEYVIDGMLDGGFWLTEPIAERLEQHTGISAEFWMNLDANCREGVKRGANITACMWKDSES